jgi:RNA polymerase-binding transcription factor DksA
MAMSRTREAALAPCIEALQQKANRLGIGDVKSASTTAIAHTVDQALGLEAVSQDDGDQSVLGELHHVASGLSHVEHASKVQVEEALARVRAQLYGVCDHCEKQIPIARMEAVPEATTCVPCLEKKGR